MNNHQQRLLVAIVAIPLIIVVTIQGGVFFFGFIALISGLALNEFYNLAEHKGAKPLKVFGLIAGFFINLAFFNNALFGYVSSIMQSAGNSQGVSAPTSEAQFLLIIVLIAIPVIGLVELFRNNGSALLNLATTLLGAFYVSLFFGTMIGIRELYTTYHVSIYKYFPDAYSGITPATMEYLYRWGGYTVVSIYAMIWICDSFAYYVGKAIGKHKLFPRVSPNKSWEGSIGGFIGAIGASISAKYIAIGYLSLSEAVTLGVIVGIFGQLGDLLESLLKRDAGVKDSSNLIPGHGGFLDRFDSLLLVAPIAYLYLDFIVFTK